MRKFYKTAEAAAVDGGHAVLLDGKPVRTPLGRGLLLPTRALAEGVAAEWAAQGAELKPETMPLTRLANTMIDKAAGPDRTGMNAELLKYGGSDLVCYFAARPADLVRRQEELWRPLLGWMEEKHGVAFDAASGIQYRHQPPEALEKLRVLIEGLDAGAFTAVQAAAATAGSVVIAFALLEGKLTPDEAHAAAFVDEVHQLKAWGDDAEARRLLEAKRGELADIARFLKLL
ncbi:MAG: ATPase [Alphaproteobacteria bacterium]|nr:ATPase [Alphaproteobacteria bacterium]MDE2337135.1 ATPase [Alphaproteobacteria bacterium]